MILPDNVLVIDNNENPIGLIEKLYITIDPKLGEIVCVIHKFDEDGNSLPDWKKRTIDRIYEREDDGLLIIKLI